MASRDIEVTVADRVYVLNFGTNSACRLEEALGGARTYGDVVQVLSTDVRPSVTLIREFVKAALVQPVDVSLDDVGTFIDNIGGWAMVLYWLKADQRGEEPTMPATELTTAPATKPTIRRGKRAA